MGGQRESNEYRRNIIGREGERERQRAVVEKYEYEPVLCPLVYPTSTNHKVTRGQFGLTYRLPYVVGVTHHVVGENHFLVVNQLGF